MDKQMNAYELAEWAKKHSRMGWAGDFGEMLETVGNTLGQQADRIAELNEEANNLARTIDGLTSEMLAKKKPLSDEEVDLKWWISSFEHLKALSGGISDEMEIKLQEMKSKLKAIEERHGVK